MTTLAAALIVLAAVAGWVRAAWKADPKGFMDDVCLWWDQFNAAPDNRQAARNPTHRKPP
jgi:hypothetical protein